MYDQRLKHLQRQLHDLCCDALLIEEPLDLLYMTGLNLSCGQLMIEPNSALLVVDGRYIEECQKNAPFPVALQEKEKNFFSKGVKNVGFDSRKTSYARFLELKDNAFTLTPLDSPLTSLRQIKDQQEIILLQKAADLGSAGYDFVLSILKEGITEKQVAQELEIFWKKKGAQGVAFEPIIAFGSATSKPHYHPSDQKLKSGDTVLIDIGVKLNHYNSDMTRVVFYKAADPEILKIYQIVKEAKEKALELCKPGSYIGNIDMAAREYIDMAGYGKYFTHGLGHGVGLEVHEEPYIRNQMPYKEKRLESGMVITIEPGIYLPGKGGVRLEDTIAVCDKGFKNLTCRDDDILTIS